MYKCSIWPATTVQNVLISEDPDYRGSTACTDAYKRHKVNCAWSHSYTRTYMYAPVFLQLEAEGLTLPFQGQVLTCHGR